MKPKRVLYIQHAGSLGGSAMSLLYTVLGLDSRRFSPVIALARPSAELHDLYSSAGIETLPAPGFALWDHSTVAPRPLHAPLTWTMYARLLLRWRSTGARTLDLVASTNADLVHLNSMPLVPSAAALARVNVPFVWHVREPPSPDRGIRYALIQRIMFRADALVFISEADRTAWTGGDVGEVIHNFVDVDRFHPDVDGSAVRRRYDIPETAPVLLFLGGPGEVKGVLPLLDALSYLKRKYPDVRCLMPGMISKSIPSRARRLRTAVRRRIPIPTAKSRFQDRVQRLGLESTVLEMEFLNDVRPVIAASDAMVFPATEPHFARPAIEAAAMGKPTVASRFPVLQELVRHQATGLLVPPSDPAALAVALERVLCDRALARRMGAEGRRVAVREFSRERQVSRLMSLYDRVLGSNGN